MQLVACRSILPITVAAGFCLLLVAACAQTDAQPAREPLPTFIPAADLTAPPSPSDDRQLLIVTLSTEARDDGSIVATTLEQVQILRTYAPNVFERPGSWTARLRTDGAGECGDEGVICYGIDDPRLVEVENTSGEPPYQYVIEPQIEWQLFVPLYDGATELGITGIDVLDENGAVVISLSYDPDTDNVLVLASPTPVPTETPTPVPTETPTVEPTATFTATPVTPTETPVNTPPVVRILRPAEDSVGADQQYAYTGFDDSRNMWYTDVAFAAVAEDSEDDSLTGRSLIWTTDRTDLQPAVLGAGETLIVRLYSNNCEGVVHRVTVTATDSAGATAAASRTIGIWTIC